MSVERVNLTRAFWERWLKADEVERLRLTRSLLGHGLGGLVVVHKNLTRIVRSEIDDMTLSEAIWFSVTGILNSYFVDLERTIRDEQSRG